MLGAFVDFIKERKTVALEDLAAQFGLRVQVCYLGKIRQEGHTHMRNHQESCCLVLMALTKSEHLRGVKHCGHSNSGHNRMVCNWCDRQQHLYKHEYHGG